MTIRAVLFDLGDTVFGLGPLDPHRGAAIAPILQREPHLPLFAQLADQLVAAVVGEWREHSLAGHTTEHDLEEQFTRHSRAMGLALSPGQVAACAEVIGRVDTVRFLDEDHLVPRIQSFRDAGYRIAFVSNTTTPPRLMTERLDAMGLHALFDAHIYSSAHGWKKPHTTIYLAALDALDISASDAIFVGDRVREDVTGPQAVGMRAALTHEYRQEDPSTGAPDAVITNLADLHGVIERLQRA